jgi:hypothetical protein
MSIAVDIALKNWNRLETYIFESCALINSRKTVKNTV